jgi:L-amino acid N-acyltransferase YncA
VLSEMPRLGVRRLYSRVWHNHIPSLRLHRKVGWRRIATSIDLCPRFGPPRFRLVVHARGAGRKPSGHA